MNANVPFLRLILHLRRNAEYEEEKERKDKRKKLRKSSAGRTKLGARGAKPQESSMVLRPRFVGEAYGSEPWQSIDVKQGEVSFAARGQITGRPTSFSQAVRLITLTDVSS